MNKTKFKQTKIGKISEDWEVKELRDFTKVQNGFAFKSSDFKAKGIPIIKIKNITPPTITFKEVQYYDEDIDNKLKPFILQKGNIIISMTGSNVNQMASAVGKVARYKSDLPALLNQRVGKLIIDSNIADSDYIYFYIARKEIQYYLAINAAGSANQANISPDTIKSVPIALPSLSEQRAIAKILSDLDEKIELNQQMNKTLEATGQAIFKHWFINFEFPNENGEPYKSSGGEMTNSELDLIPKRWKIERLKKIIRFVKGKKPKVILKEKSDELSKYLTINVLSEKDYLYAHPKGVILTEKDNILMVMDGASSGKIYFGSNGIVASTIAKVEISNNNFSTECIYHFLKYNENEINNHTTGSAIPHTDKNFVLSLKIALPDANDIMFSKFNKALGSIENKIIQNNDENKRLAKIRDSLLPKLMSGEIRVPINDKEGDE